MSATVAFSSLTDKAPGLGIATVVSAVIAGIILQVTRRVRGMPSYLVSTFSCFSNKSSKLVIAATVFYYVVLALPLALLAAWVIVLGVNVGTNPALPVLFVGLFFIFMFIPSSSSLFYAKVLAMLLSYLTAEMLLLGLVFDGTKLSSFWTLTAISCTVNSILVIVCLWFIDGSTWTIHKRTPSTIIDKIRQSVKIWKELENPPEVIDGGLYGKVTHLSDIGRAVVISVTYLLSLLVLLTYTLIGKYHTVTNFQALVNSVALITTDAVSFMLIIISRETGFNPNFNAVVVILVRACIVGFSGQFWFLGYCLLYLLMFVYIAFLVINKYYPTYEKPPITEIRKTNILKMPELALLILVLIFSGLVFYMGQDQGRTLPIDRVVIGQSTYPFWAVGVAAVLLSFSAFFYLLSLRIVSRSQRKVRSISVYYLGCESCSEYYFFIFTSYFFLVILGCYLYTVVGNHLIWASCVFLPVFYQFFVIFYLNWAENDYLIFGDMNEFNKKIKKKKERDDKINKMKSSVINKMKEQNQGEAQLTLVESSNLRMMDNAFIEDNFVLDNGDKKSEYDQWRDEMNIIDAIKFDRILPTDRRILISVPVMVLTLVGYSIAFFFSQDRDMTAFTVSVEILVLFLIFIPVKRYFSTFEKPNALQIVSLILGFALNYAFGIISYVVGWNSSPAYTVLWAVINLFLVVTYGALSLIRDKGLTTASIICAVASMLLSFGAGIIVLAWFGLVAAGIALLAVAFFFTYFTTVYLIYLRMNSSVPFAVYPLTAVIIVGTSFAVMIYSFTTPSFDDFYGFSITYLVINVLGLIYATYRVGSDIATRDEKPNYYSPYGAPVYKYDSNIKSVVENPRPLQLWSAFWLMFYAYTLLMQIFIADTNIGTATSMLPFIMFAMTFIFTVTYNVYRAGRIRQDITEDILETSWVQVLKNQDRSLGSFLNLDQLEKQYAEVLAKVEAGDKTILTNQKIGPAHDSEEANKTTENINLKKDEMEVDIKHLLYDLEVKIDKARQNDKILLVNYWTNIIFKTESLRRKKMLGFVNFIRDSGDVLAEAGITLVLNDKLYSLQLTYNQAYQELLTLSPFQRIFFNKNMKLYQERKEKEDKQKEEINRKEMQNQLKRHKELENKFGNDQNKQILKQLINDPNTPIEKLPDGPAKLKRLKEALKGQLFTDTSFPNNNDIIPAESRPVVKGWKRPGPGSVVLKTEANTGMAVRQGQIGNCYLISAIGVLGKERIHSIVMSPSEGPAGAYMVKFNKFNKEIYVIVDDTFPVFTPTPDNQWCFGRCEDERQLFCNIIQKAYAKLYGGYHNIVGGKVSLALSDMTGGFPEEIELKPYQQTNTNQLFQKMVEFKKAGYLMGAGSPPNAKGDSVEVDGIYQGHAYLVMDVRNLDGNKLLKIRNPHGNNSTESRLDWCDDSPKWTSRLKGLLGEPLGEDGAFWMGLEDFVHSFRSLYICRIFDGSWIKVGPFNGEWKGKTAAGLKSASGNPVLRNNPHYGIRVSKACTLFVELTQNEGEAGKGKNKIFFMVQRNSGKRIDAPATNKMAGMSGPAINSKTISKEISLTAESFPYTFSLMTSVYESGLEGSFSLSMYCNDRSIQVIQNNQFDI